MESNVRLFRVKGIPVGVNWSWLFVFVLFFASLATSLFPATYPGLSGSTYVVMAAVATLLFFGSVLVHELSHALVSLREGVRVRAITLWLFGGVTEGDELPDAKAELRVVGAGPASSGGLALLFLGLTALARAVDASEAVRGVCDYLARINALLAAFNLVPALPLDGGRILHAVLWRRSGDRLGATIWAARAGRAFGLLLVAIGFLTVLTGGGLGGLWFVFLGWFLYQAARQEDLSARLEYAVRRFRVRDVMVPSPVTVTPDLAVEQVGDDVWHRSPHGAYPVVDDGRLVGVLPMRALADVPRAEWPGRRVADVAVPADDVPVARPDDELTTVLDAFRAGAGRVVVLGGPTGDEVVGIVSPADVTRALELAPLAAPPDRRARPGLGIALVVVLVMLIAAAALYHPPYVSISPGGANDIRGDISISGVPAQTPTGRYLMTAVRLRQPSALVLLVDLFRDDREVHSLRDVTPPDVAPGRVEDFERQLFLDSQQMAAAAAARAAGYDATITGRGAEVVGIVRSSPASAVLDPGDVIVAADGRPVSTVDDLHNALRGRPAGARVTLTVERDGRRMTVTVKTRRLPEVSGGAGIGIVAQTRDLRVVLPFQIRFRDRPNVGGPSAGLAYALAITDMLDPADDARSRTVAATGTISSDGTVGPVGGVHEKAISVDDAGADVFFVPDDEVDDVDLRGLDVQGVDRLDEAVKVLRTV